MQDPLRTPAVLPIPASSAATPAARLVALRALCRSALPGDVLMPALLEAIELLVPARCKLFDWTDAQGRLQRYCLDGPFDAEAARHYFAHFHNRREAEAMLPFDALLAQPAGVRGPDDLGPAFYRSALYHEVWLPQQFHTRLEAVVRTRDGRLLGSLVLYRGPHDLPFTRDDARRLDQLLPDIALALQPPAQPLLLRPALPALADLPAPEPSEALLLTLDGSVCHASASAWRWLLMATGGLTPQALLHPEHGAHAHPLLQQVLQPLRHWRDGSVPPRIVASCDGIGGRHEASAQLLLPTPGVAMPPLVQVTLRRHEPHRVALARALRALPLTPGQAEVCQVLYHGLPQPEIAQRLGVSPTTVVDHVRKAYRALEVDSAQALRVLLDRCMAAVIERAPAQPQPR